jgi:hypothetical protein
MACNLTVDDLRCDFVASPLFSALAASIDRQKRIGVSAGAVDVLVMSFFAFIVDPESLAQVGDAEEKIRENSFWHKLSAPSDPDVVCIPRDPKSPGSPAMLLGLHAPDVLMDHQHSYQFRGRVALLNRESPNAESFERPAIRLSPNEARVRSTLEIGAQHVEAVVRLERIRNRLLLDKEIRCTPE